MLNLSVYFHPDTYGFSKNDCGKCPPFSSCFFAFLGRKPDNSLQAIGYLRLWLQRFM